MALMTTYVSTATSVVMPSVRLLGLQLLNFVPEPVKAVILLFSARGRLEELTNPEEEEMKEKGATLSILLCFGSNRPYVSLALSDYRE